MPGNRPPQRGHDRLTLPENWGQIDPADRDFVFLSSWRCFLGLAFMRCSSRPLRARTDAVRAAALRRAVAWSVAVAVVAHVWPAQRVTPAPAPAPHPTPTPHAHPDTAADAIAYRYQFRSVGRRGRDQPRQQFSGAARQPGDQRLRRARRGTIRAAAALRRRPTRRASGPGARPTEFRPGPARRAISSATSVRPGAASPESARARARRQCRPFGRPEPYRHRRSAGAAVGDARSHPDRLQRLGGQGAVDLGDRAGARLWTNQFEPGHRASASPAPATTPRSTAR